MESLTETELIRARWRRYLRTEALDTAERDDFARHGLANRVRDLAFRLLLLPYDPDQEVLDVEAASEHLENHKRMDLGNSTIGFGTKVTPSAYATALIDRQGPNEPWDRFVALYRNGAVELCLGDRGRQFAGEASTKSVQLIALASFSWATLELARGIDADIRYQPCLLTVALPNTTGAILNNLANGYREPDSRYDDARRCLEDHLLWHIELDRLPATKDETEALALNIAARIVRAWGVTTAWYLDQDGQFAGKLNVRRAAQ